MLFSSQGECSACQSSGREEAPTHYGGDHAVETETLRDELRLTTQRLQAIVDERDAANQELTSANEEIQSSNEELQSINEELETAKEELQSSNEELSTLNEELQTRFWLTTLKRAPGPLVPAFFLLPSVRPQLEL